MSKIICANCGRNNDIHHGECKSPSGATIGIVYLCDVCKMLMKSVDINFTVDDDKVERLKEVRELSEKKKSKNKKALDNK